MYDRAHRTAPRPRDAEHLVELPAAPAVDPVRAFAYDAVRRIPLGLWLHLPCCIDEAVPALARQLPELATSGARWTGAGYVGSWSASWYSFSGAGDSGVIIAASPNQVEISIARLHGRGIEVERTRTGRVPRRVLTACESMVALPVWDLVGFAHLAPGARLRAGYATAAA